MSELDEFLKTVVPRQIQADNALLNGDPQPRVELWSHHDPVTILGARWARKRLGPGQRGVPVARVTFL